MRYLKIAIFLFVTISLKGQMAPPDGLNYKFEFIKGEKESYSIGDTVCISIVGTQKGKVCEDGVGRTRLFCKGLKIYDETLWKEIKPGNWQKIVTIIISGNKANQYQFTAFRKTDKGEIAKTLNFKANKNK